MVISNFSAHCSHGYFAEIFVENFVEICRIKQVERLSFALDNKIVIKPIIF